MSSPYPATSSNHGRRRGSTIREEKKNLFQDAQSSQRGKSGANSTAHEAQSIQQSLQRTQNLLKNELNRVSQVASAIDEDGRLLEDTKETHQSLNVSGAKKALTSLQRAQQQEQRVLLASVFFFLAVVFYIMWQRILVKLPFVERILNLVVMKTNQLFGQSLHLVVMKTNQLFGRSLHSARELLGEAMAHVQQLLGEAMTHVQRLLGEAMIHVQPGLEAAKEWGHKAWYAAEEKGKELYHKIQEMIPEKE